MSASTPHHGSQSPAASPGPRREPNIKKPPRKPWPQFKKKVNEDALKEAVKQGFGYEPHEWQLQAAVKVLEGNDGIVVAGTGKGKTMVFAILGLAVKLSETKGYYVIVSPLKALEGDQVCTAFSVEAGLVQY